MDPYLPSVEIRAEDRAQPWKFARGTDRKAQLCAAMAAYVRLAIKKVTGGERSVRINPIRSGQYYKLHIEINMVGMHIESEVARNRFNMFSTSLKPLFRLNECLFLIANFLHVRSSFAQNEPIHFANSLRQLHATHAAPRSSLRNKHLRDRERCSCVQM